MELNELYKKTQSISVLAGRKALWNRNLGVKRKESIP